MLCICINVCVGVFKALVIYSCKKRQQAKGIAIIPELLSYMYTNIFIQHSHPPLSSTYVLHTLFVTVVIFVLVFVFVF